ncbi:MAG TPA: DUF2795 domain-containing protein [Armatimonadota bacterium]|jgi:hypothetical protein
MALYCSRDIFAALDGMHFPATKEDILDAAELKDAQEAVVVALNQLNDKAIYNDMEEVCENVRIMCNVQILHVMARAPFPARREQLMEFAKTENAPQYVIDAVAALPGDYTFNNVDAMCDYVT